VILLDSITKSAIEPALALLPARMDSPEARIMLLAIGLQESRFMFRFQKVAGKPYLKGPAKSYWQFEEGGGVKGVMTHHATRLHAKDLCDARGVPFDSTAIHHAMENDDVLAAGLARLLLFADPRKLPAVNASHEEAWDCYVRNWRPGKPHRHTWDEFHKQAVAQVTEAMT
jgi:hypothetical protein